MNSLLKEYYNIYFKAYYRVEFEDMSESNMKFLEGSLGFYSFMKGKVNE